MTKKITKVVATVVILGLMGKLGVSLYNKQMRYNETRKDAICPALFSISRSARDTLIVMKAEPLCNTFMLDNLK